MINEARHLALDPKFMLRSAKEGGMETLLMPATTMRPSKSLCM